MSEIWNWKRFGHVLSLDVRRDIRKFALRAGVVFGVSLGAYAFAAPDEAILPGESVFDLAGFGFVGFLGLFAIYIMGLMNAVKAFSDYSHRESCWMAILLPASRLEKYVSTFLWSAIFVPLCYVVLFCLAFLIVFSLSPNVGFEALSLPGELKDNVSEMLAVSGVNKVLICGLLGSFWLMCQSIVFAGGAVFRKHPMILTIISIIAISVVSRKVLGQAMTIDKMSSADTLLESVRSTLLTFIGTFGVVMVAALVVGWIFYRRKSVV